MFGILINGDVMFKFTLLVSSMLCLHGYLHALEDLDCNGEYSAGSFLNVNVAPGANCSLLGDGAGGIHIAGNVLAADPASLQLGANGVSASVAVDGNIVVRGLMPGGQLALASGLTVGANVHISDAGANSLIILQAVTGPMMVYGNVMIRDNLAARIVLEAPTIHGNLTLLNNQVAGDFDDPNFTDDGIYVIFPSVGGHSRLQGNAVGSESLPEDGVTAEHGILWLQNQFGGNAYFLSNSADDKNIAIGLQGAIPGNLVVADNLASGGIAAAAFFSDLLVEGNLAFFGNQVSDVEGVVPSSFDGLLVGGLAGFEQLIVLGNASVRQNQAALNLPLQLIGLSVDGNLKCLQNDPGPILINVSAAGELDCGD